MPGAQTPPGTLPPPPRPRDLSPDTLAQTLDALEARPDHCRDAPRLGFIRGLLRRADALGGESAGVLKRRAQAALGGYLDGLHRDRARAQDLGQRLLAAHPDRAGDLQSLLACHDIGALVRLERRLQRARGDSALAALTRELAASTHLAANDSSGDFSDRVRSQERELLAAYAVDAPGTVELRAARRYRQAAQRAGVEHLVSASIANSPEESGPLNPQKLATRALATMRELSPACSTRYVAYLSTLLHLESLQ
nr:DUF2894 domain-containing protein [Parahaliea mediterranea]